MQQSSVGSDSIHVATEAVRQFHLLTVAHPRLVEAKDRLMSAICDAAPGSLILVIGPTGVGKTTLRLKAECLIAEQMRPALDADPGRIPYLSIEAVAPESGNFSWRDHFYRMLEQMKEPLPDRKLNACQFHFERSERGQFTSAPRGSGIGLQHATEQALQHRRPAVVFIDEAQHLSRMASGRRLSDQLDVIKSMANRTETVHVLLGTYDLVAFRNLSGQLSRRSTYLHFRRYLAPAAMIFKPNPPAAMILTHSQRRPLFKFLRFHMRAYIGHRSLSPLKPRSPASYNIYARSAGCVRALSPIISTT